MTLRVALMAALTVTSIAWPIAVQAQAPEMITVAARDRDAEEQALVCKYQPRSNSRLKDRICKTKLQWEQMRIQQQRDAEEMFDRPMIDQKSSNPAIPN